LCTKKQTREIRQDEEAKIPVKIKLTSTGSVETGTKVVCAVYDPESSTLYGIETMVEVVRIVKL
jgi:hypothetical protein